MEEIQSENEYYEEISSTEIILYDVLDQIFSYLNVYDLHRASKVCKSWYETAKIEKLKRGPQVMVLQALEDHVATGYSNAKPIDENEVIDDFSVALRAKPLIGLFFTDGKCPATSISDSVTREITQSQQWTQPIMSVYEAIEVSGVNVNDRIIGGEKNITAAVFFPDLPSVNYRYADASTDMIVQCFRGRDYILTNITRNLFTPDALSTCFLIFIYHQWENEPTYANYHNRFLDNILDSLKTRYAPGTYSLWGGGVHDIFLRTRDATPSFLHTRFFAVAISGTSIKSWSIALNIKLSETEIVKRLQNFKRRVCLSSSSIAFVMLPTSEDRIDRSKIDIFKNIFPSITLLGIFNSNNNVILSVDTLSDESNPVLKHTNCYAYVILTYKL